MPFANGVAAAVGRTPLIKLKRASEETGCTILGKAEFMNPGQSVKDRAALFIIQDAVKRGSLRPGGTVVEGTAGNTGIGITVVGNALRLPLGHRHPRDAEPGEEGRAAAARRRTDRGAGSPLQEPEQVRALFRPPGRGTRQDRAQRRHLGQPVGQHRQPPGPHRNDRPGNLGAIPTARSTVSSPRSAQAERWAAFGWPQGQAQDIQIALADVPGAALYSYYTTGVLKSEGSSITEGIGQGRITKNIEGAVVDHAYLIPDAESVAVCFQLLAEEGLCVGGSTGVNVAGAIRLAREMGPGHTIVTLLCDYGTRYQSKLFNPEFLQIEEPAGAGMARCQAPAAAARCSSIPTKVSLVAVTETRGVLCHSRACPRIQSAARSAVCG